MLILVEGRTEHLFVKRVLAPHLERSSVYVKPTILRKNRNPSGPDDRGGYVTRAKLIRELRTLLGHSAAHVTTLLDYYGLPDRLPSTNVDAEEQRLAVEVGEQRRFIPYFQKHEFEALLFSDCETAGNSLGNPQLAAQMASIVTQCGGAEEINDNPATCPSRRLKALVPTYNKEVDGSNALLRIGIPTVAQQCPRFGRWVERLAALGSA
jgi:hypothetical protein